MQEPMPQSKCFSHSSSSSSSTLHMRPRPCAASPLSIMAVLLLLNALAFLSLRSPFTPRLQHRLRRLSSPSLASLREDTPLSSNTTHNVNLSSTASLSVFSNPVASHLVSDGLGYQLPPPPPVSDETHKLLGLQRRPAAKSRRVLKLIQQSSKSRRFAARAKAFLSGGGGCKTRFFLTWISPLEAAFGPRESLTVESIFKFHPDACVLLLSHAMDSAGGRVLLRPFSSMGLRIAAFTPDLAFILAGTPAEAWLDRLKQGSVDPGDVPLGQNLSNLLRLAVLYKFGGIYVDADVVILRSFATLRNAIGAQAADVQTGNWSRLNNAVMVFDRRHPLLYKFMEEFASTFNGNKWGHNGPYLVSRVVAREPPPVVGAVTASKFSVLPPMAFYPVDWGRIGSLFHGPRSEIHTRWAKAKLDQIRGESFAIHLWNRQSRGLKVEEGSVIERLMLDSCLFCNPSSWVSSL